MRRAGILWRAGVAALFACGAFGACTYDFDTLVAQTGTGGSAGIGGAGGTGGSSGAGGSDDGGGGSGGMGPDGSAGAGGKAGAGGNAGTGGTGGSGTDAGGADAGKAGADAGKGGSTGTDAGPDRIADVRVEAAPFDCSMMGGATFQGRCYYPSPTPTNWDTANTAGCLPPSHLVVITSQQEQNVVATILPNAQRWIGLRKDPGSPNMESSFHWVTAEPLGFKTWETYDTGLPEPNYTGECVRMQPSGRWGDTACSDSIPAVCERE